MNRCRGTAARRTDLLEIQFEAVQGTPGIETPEDFLEAKYGRRCASTWCPTRSRTRRRAESRTWHPGRRVGPARVPGGGKPDPPAPHCLVVRGAREPADHPGAVRGVPHRDADRPVDVAAPDVDERGVATRSHRRLAGPRLDMGGQRLQGQVATRSHRRLAGPLLILGGNSPPRAGGTD